MITNLVLIDSLTDMEVFPVRVENQKDALKVKKSLEYHKLRAINVLKELKKEGLIKSIYQPKNKKIQPELNRLVRTKRQINESLEKIKAVYK